MIQSGALSVTEVCRRLGVSRKTAYKWLKRFEEAGSAGLDDLSRRPHRSPGRSSPGLEERVLSVRSKHPRWGGRKIRQILLGQEDGPVPSASTITEILRRHGKLDPAESSKHRAFQRFERAAPNDLWQMDFKGHFSLRTGRCHPLTVLDDHSRFSLALQACADEETLTVKTQLIQTFRIYGLPRQMLMDNGAPWGCDPEHQHTPLTVWLIRLGIAVSHGRPYHPQTQGKEERFHRTLKAEVVSGREFEDLIDCQLHFDRWRPVYNYERPHEGIGMQVPGDRYRSSERPYPEDLPPIEYAPGDVVRKVQEGGAISLQGKIFRLPKAFRGQPVALRATAIDGVMDVYYCQEPIAELDLRTEQLTRVRGRRGSRVRARRDTTCDSS
jgi:transposase InsO family protein